MWAELLLQAPPVRSHPSETSTDITPIDSFPSLKIHVAELLRRKREARRWGAGACILAALLTVGMVFALVQHTLALAFVFAVLAVAATWWGYTRLALK